MNRKQGKMRIRTMLIVIFTALTAGALVLLLLFQGLFWDDFYRSIKIADAKKAVQDVKLSLLEDDPMTAAHYWNTTEQIDIYIFTEQGKVLLTDHHHIDATGPVSAGELQAAYKTALDGDGTFFLHKQTKVNKRRIPDDAATSPAPPPKPSKPDSQMKVNESAMYGELVYENDNQAPNMVLAVTNITPVDATTRTLAVQLLMASAVIVGFSVLVAFLLAKYLASPIEALNRAAKGLADGTYCSPKKRAGYLEAVQLQETMDQVDVDLQKSEQLRQELIANVSHDLRTPLTMIRGYSEAIRDLPDEDHTENIQVVIDEANRLSELVNDLLDLSKLQSGVLVLDRVPLNLTEFVRETVDRLSRMVEFDDYHLSFDAEEDVWVQADAMRLSRVVYNLITNAIYYSGDDHCVEIRQLVSKETVRLSFIDHGKGISAEELDNIWKRYYRVRSGTDAHANAHGNSGLGLSIVQTLISLHGGSCGVDSELGAGSEFWIELPLCKKRI